AHRQWNRSRHAAPLRCLTSTNSRTAADQFPLAARSRAAPPLEATAHGIGNIAPGGGSRPLARQTVLVDDVDEREPIRYRDPGVAHPDVEIALVLLIGLLRKLCALSSHPPRVVGLGSHDLPSGWS